MARSQIGQSQVTTSPEARAWNEVRVIGRLSKAATARELPSGDTLVAFVLVVDRPASRRGLVGSASGQTHDSLDCTAWTAPSRRRALSLQPGEVVEVTGALRRRFWGAGATRASRYDIEVLSLKRCRQQG